MNTRLFKGKKVTAISFKVNGIVGRAFFECNIFDARKEVSNRGVVIGVKNRYGYGVFEAYYVKDLEDLNATRGGLSLRRRGGSEVTYGYYLSELSYKELDDAIVAKENKEKEDKKERLHLKYLADVELGAVDFKRNLIYTDGVVGSLTFYLNGKEWRLLGMSSHPLHWNYLTQNHEHLNNQEQRIFNKAYEDGAFDTIGYQHMTESGYDIYLSGVCS